MKGLQNPLVKSIAKDSLGFVWAATDEGIIRFDGKNFLQIKKGLPSPYVKNIFTTSSGVTLATTDLGLIKVKTSAAHPEIELLIEGDAYASDSLLWFPKQIFESKNNDIWVADNHSINLLDSSFKIKQRYQFSEKDIPTNFQRSFTILEDRRLGIYAFSEAGYFYRYNKIHDQFEEISLLSQLDRVNHAFFKDGLIYVSTDSGFFSIWLNKSGDEVLSQTILINNFSPSWVVPFTEDLWLVTTWNNGFFVIDTSEKEFKITKMKEVSSRVINSIYLEGLSEIWLSTDNGITLLKEQYFTKPFKDISSGYVQDIIEEGDEVVYTDGHAVYFTNVIHEGVEKSWQIPSNYGIVLRLLKRGKEYWMSTNIGYILVYSVDGELLKKLDLSEGGGAIYNLVERKGEIWYVQDHGGVYRLKDNSIPISYGREKGLLSKVNVLKVEKGTLYAGGSDNHSYIFSYRKRLDRFVNLSVPLGFEKVNKLSVNDFIIDRKQIVMATNLGLAILDEDELNLKQVDNLDLGEVKTIKHDKRHEKVYWISNSRGVIRIEDWKNYLIFDELSGLPSKTLGFRSMLISDDGEVWAGTTAGIGISSGDMNLKKTPKPIFTKISNATFDFINIDNPEISSSSYIDFEFSSLCYPGAMVEFKYRYNDGPWKSLGWNNSLIASGLETGEYVLQIKAKQIGEFDWSDSTNFSFVVEEKWYKTVYGLAGIILFLLGLGYVAFKLYDEKVQYDKEILEKLILERTNQVASQNKVLSNREEILKKQIDKFKSVNDKLKYQQKEMTQRLYYARSLQSIVLPPNEKINSYFIDSFVMFKAKEKVSGDFYWMKTFKERDEEICYFVLSDCIGHGTAGGIQSLFGMQLLEQIVVDKNITVPNILEQMDELLREKSTKDPTLVGMDMMVLRFKKYDDGCELSFASAKRPLFYVSENKFHEVKGTRRAIGNEPEHVRQKGFTEHKINLHKGNTIYLTSNGFYDQFNGEKKRIGIAKFRKILHEISQDQSFETQKVWLENYFTMWKASAEQIDDVTIVGLNV
ncbi:SpoIIE family protein phosphatase [Flammeovirga yaeyamensis]|uniref:SpoIIE family protein phosphatase n=1 Tax=Flammeovirga yaeyamensis TaxID=367791 RepID=A0AAX1N5X3_9BACT|nr:SpoIIE family protein phosphatase [Flammeovirga yaeyamensis]MBB3698368.1 serine phosphatase RsbU (regulator of sigma subunit)/ligand-binding sensor domain-containing protein [Flammeovirga yaeyamensis]NMF34280.1 SpoIIE family protein phosphatase [Flammeovirga yaeyamensis]QWG01263.1 SpoIIE family protein phosphatase [Flammeovirga yaeyamensis]